ncbi:MAG TPA: hypothetical protein VGA37_05995 [Gemmatimonadales bacterium]
MPSDTATASAFAQLAGLRAAHRSVVATTVEEVRGYLESHRGTTDTRSERAAAELGLLGGRHIDLDRFAALVVDAPTLNGSAGATVERALETLTGLTRDGDEQFRLELPPGGDLVVAVGRALAEAGRGFGAARVVRLARNGGYRVGEHENWLVELPFAMWTAAERALAPPLVVALDGADLRVAGLANYLDGNLKLVLIVQGGAVPPAPLVRLITPRVFVAQSHDGGPVDRLAAHEGPGVVAVMPRGAASFVHDPSAGATLAERLAVTSLPDTPPRKRIGTATAFQQAEELAQLQTLASAIAAAPVAPGTSAPASNPADKLAAWLLTQANLATGS